MFDEQQCQRFIRYSGTETQGCERLSLVDSQQNTTIMGETQKHVGKLMPRGQVFLPSTEI